MKKLKIYEKIIKNFYSIFFICSILFFSKWKRTKTSKYLQTFTRKKFEEGIKNLELLSQENDINAQLLYSKILFSGDLTPQDFENSYFWGFSALLGGLKNSSNILEKLEEYLSEEQISEITIKLKDFLELKAFTKDKRAIIQIAKLYENFTEPPDLVNAYTWYNIAVAQGISTAKPKRDEVLDKLNEKDLLDAQSLSIKLFKKINN